MTTWTPKETKEHRRLWVEALRSGKYQQGRRVLRGKDGGMCCLGVACEISGLVKWSDELVGEKYDAAGYEPLIDGVNFGRFYAPPAVMSWLGIEESNGRYFVSGVKTNLGFLNDQGAGFKEIAGIIESEPTGLLATSPTE